MMTAETMQAGGGDDHDGTAAAQTVSPWSRCHHQRPSPPRCMHTHSLPHPTILYPGHTHPRQPLPSYSATHHHGFPFRLRSPSPRCFTTAHVQPPRPSLPPPAGRLSPRAAVILPLRFRPAIVVHRVAGRPGQDHSARHVRHIHSLPACAAVCQLHHSHSDRPAHPT